MRRSRSLFAASLVITALSGCFDGGSSGPPPPTITASSPPPGTTGVAYPGYTFSATGGTRPLTWSESGSLPPGLSLSSGGQLSGNPTTAGTYPITVAVTDSSAPPQTAHAAVNIHINDSTIVIASASPPAGTVTYAYPGFGFSASGGSPPYKWTANGTVPPGLTVGSDGTVSGTPTQVGLFSFSVTATDSAQLPVSGPPLATQIIINAPATLALSPTPAPPAGVLGTPYGPFSFSTSGGYLPLHWNVTAGVLPPGLALGSGGSLSGTPTGAIGSPFTFTVSVTDSAPAPISSSQVFTISVTVPPPPVISNTEPPTGTVGVALAPFQFMVQGGTGVAPLTWTEVGALPGGLSLVSDGVLSGTPTVAGKFPITVDVTDALNRSGSASVTVRVSLPHSGSFTLLPAGLSVPRSGHAATLLLPEGANPAQVLLTGGGKGVADASAELYDPAKGTFTATSGPMNQARIGHTATLLSNPTLANYGKVLIAASSVSGTSAELYDPATGKFTATGSMQHPRAGPTATLLGNPSLPGYGKVLIVGGNTTAGDLTAELYDPATQTFSDTLGGTSVLRTGHTATLLLDGRVLVAGGTDPNTGPTVTAEIYDPRTGTFTPTGNMTIGRVGATATRLQDGSVLVVGTEGSADLFDPKTGAFIAVGGLFPAYPASYQRTASLRNDGTALVVGGYFGHLGYYFREVPPGVQACARTWFAKESTASSAVFATESDGFTPAGSLNVARGGHTATVFADGTVLVAGGTLYVPGTPTCNPPEGAKVLSSAERFE